MADPGLTLGLDLGTSGVRAVVLDPAGGIRAAADRAITAADRNDPNAVLAAVLAVLEAAVRGCGGPVSRLCVAGTSGTLLALDAHGGAVGPISLYSDTAAAPAQARAAAVGAGPVAARALEALARPGVVRLAFEPDWILGHLAGHPVPADLNSALKAGADPLAACWSGPVRALGLAAVLPDLAQPGASLARAGAGPVAGAMLHAGTTDGCAAALAAGLAQTGDAVTILGSTLVLKVLSDVPVTSAKHGVYSHRLLGRWLVGGASNAGGAVLRQFFTDDEAARLGGQVDPQRPTGLGYVPLTRPGERFPIADPELSPVTGPRPASDVVFLQGLLEALVAVERRGYRTLAALGAPEPRRLIAQGGGRHNPGWMALRAAQLPWPQATARFQDTAAGAALLAMAGFQRGIGAWGHSA